MTMLVRPAMTRFNASWIRDSDSLSSELVASSTGHASSYAPGERVFHQKFGYGHVAEVEGNKLTIDFDKAGRKRVVDSFVARADRV